MISKQLRLVYQNSSCAETFEWKEAAHGGKKMGYAWSNITTKSMLTLPKYAQKAAIFMKYTGLLGQFKLQRKLVDTAEGLAGVTT